MRRFYGLLAVAIAAVAGLVWSSITSSGSTHADDNYPTIDGAYSGTGPITSGGTMNLVVTGRGGVPSSGVGAVVLNVAVTNVTAASFLTAWPTGQPRPTAANLNFQPGDTVPNAIVVKVGDGGQVSFFNYGGNVDVVVDVQGWFPEGAAFTGLTPARLLDTRPGYPTIDGNFTGTGPVSHDSFTNLTVVGRGGVPGSGVGAVVMNVTVANASAPSFMTVWPAGTARPTAANLNYGPGDIFQNLVIAKVGDGGQVSMYNFGGSVDVIVDVLGWFPEANSFVGLTPARLMDTRAGYSTIDGSFAGVGSLGPNGTANLTVLGRGGVPATGVGAVALNVAVTNPSAASFLTAWPTGTARPTAANLNYTPGQTIPNMIIAAVGAGGQVSLYNLAGTVDVIVDVLGWFPANGTFNGLTPARLMDTRKTVVTPPTTTAPPTPTVTTAPPTTGPGLDPRFDTCTQAKAAGYGPYYRGQDPEYDWYDDRDNDGIVCE